MLYILTIQRNHGNHNASLKIVICCIFSHKADVYFYCSMLAAMFLTFRFIPLISHHNQGSWGDFVVVFVSSLIHTSPRFSVSISFLFLFVRRLRACRTRFITAEAVQFGIDLRQTTWFPVRPRRKLNFEYISTPPLSHWHILFLTPYLPTHWGRLVSVFSSTIFLQTYSWWKLILGCYIVFVHCYRQFLFCSFQLR